MITKRNIILLTLTALFIGLNFMFSNFFIDGKIKTIKKLETAHKDVNEKYITAQILSQKRATARKLGGLFRNRKKKGLSLFSGPATQGIPT